MVSLKVSLSYLKERTRWNEAAILEALPQVKASVESVDGDEVTVEVTGDRPDLLCRQGIARAINGLRASELGAPKMEVKPTRNEVFVDESVLKVRPVIVCALARGLSLRDADVAELMQVQEKLTLTHGRRRRKVAIGIHDARPIKFPLRYAAYAGREISFVPLGCEREMNLDEILREHPKGKEYAWTLQGFSQYPVITDANGAVISFPPIINGTLTTVTDATTDLFLDVTGTDFDACNVALNILCQNYADDGARIESVTVHSKGVKLVCPETRPEKMVLNAKECNKALGLTLTKQEIVNCLRKQRIDAQDAKGNDVIAFIPRYRADFLHEVDLIEEVALGFGYNAFTPLKPRVFTRGAVSALTELSDRARDALAGAGFVEFAGFILTSEAKTLRAESPEKVIKIKNPVSDEYNALRSSLLPGILEVLSENTHRTYPQRLFEVGETIERDAASDARTRTTLKACAVSAHAEASFSEAVTTITILAKALERDFFLERTATRQFIEGRCARIMAGNKEIGVVGEVHPKVLSNYGVQVPAAGFEMILE
ncbi:MAG: phenylalanine--tRNA ligase subunit beta [Candidatus Norongarragalinales archaeon]